VCGVCTAYHAFDIPELALVNKNSFCHEAKNGTSTLTFRVVLDSDVKSVLSVLYKPGLGTL
jgi:hypothetical protein